MAIQMNIPMPKEAPKEGYQWVFNIASRTWVQQPVDTPWFCRVDSETYWSS